MLFRRKKKINLKYIESFDILFTVGEVPFELTLSPDFAIVHLVFYVSILRCYILDES